MPDGVRSLLRWLMPISPQRPPVMKKEMILHSLPASRLIMINSTPAILEGILKGGNLLQEMLDIRVPDQWTEFGPAPFEYALHKINDTPADAFWWSWLPVLVSENMLIGNSGYKGPPKDGVVEIGYEVARDYRRKGYATEMAKALVDNAFQHAEVHTILAHTLPEENESVSVLRKCGFTFSGEYTDPEDGPIWRWYLLKSIPDK
jgi:ribosomal-protein-alanine N-acetyltransferase